MLNVRRCTIWVAVLLCAGIGVAAEKSFSPMAVGNRWEYTVTETGGISMGEGTDRNAIDTKGSGTEVIEITSIKESRLDGDVVYVKRTTQKMQEGLNTRARNTVAEALELESAKGSFCTAYRMTDADGVLSDKWTKYEPPILNFPSDLNATSKWTVGVLKEAGLNVPLEAKSAGTETITVPAGTFKDCLKVIASSSKITGDFGATAAKATVKQGKTTNTSWYCPGVGMVKSEIVTELKIEFTDRETSQKQTIDSNRRSVKELMPGYRVR